MSKSEQVTLISRKSSLVWCISSFLTQSLHSLWKLHFITAKHDMSFWEWRVEYAQNLFISNNTCTKHVKETSKRSEFISGALKFTLLTSLRRQLVCEMEFDYCTSLLFVQIMAKTNWVNLTDINSSHSLVAFVPGPSYHSPFWVSLFLFFKQCWALRIETKEHGRKVSRDHFKLNVCISHLQVLFSYHGYFCSRSQPSKGHPLTVFLFSPD